MGSRRQCKRLAALLGDTIKVTLNAQNGLRSKPKAMKYTALRAYACLMFVSGVLVHGGLPTVQPGQAETETTAPEMQLSIETHKVPQPDKGDSGVDSPDEKDPDGRSAFINNQFVADEDMDEGGVQSQPLYEILQKQMEHVLSATAPNLPHYAHVNAANDHDHGLEKDNVQRPPKRPTFSSNYEAELEDYSELDSDFESEEIGSHNSYSQISHTTTQSIRTPTTKRKQSTNAVNITTTRKPSRYPNAHINSTSTISTPTSPTQPVAFIAQTRKNQYNPSQPQFATKNSDKQNIIFRTISTGSQYVNSPMGDLIIKFSVAYAKPTEMPANVNEALKALSNNLLKQSNGIP